MAATINWTRIIGRTAFLNDIHCAPGQVGACRIVARSRKGVDYVVVEWEKDGNHHELGDVDAVPITWLTVR